MQKHDSRLVFTGVCGLYALCNAVHIYNTSPVLPDGTSRLEKFSGTTVGFRMKDNHTFGCPVFAL
jgi:hypothetical protein